MPNDSLQLRDDLLACLPSLEIHRPLAESGQRVVYLARFEDKKIPPDVLPTTAENSDDKPFLHGWEAWGDIVVKVVSGADPQALARLQAETAILEDIRPSNFPKLLYSNLFSENPLTEERLPERLYVTIEEFIESTPLNELFAQCAGNEVRVVELALGVADALLPLWQHPKRFVHRDIKPENILIRRNGKVAVIDLGIARQAGTQGLTENGWGRAPFTAGYAAPEQIANDKVSVSFKSDFFSIGVLMYRLLSGKEPFRPRPGMGMHEIMMAAQNHHPAALTVTANSSQAFSDFVAKALQKEPFKRHRTPALFIQELQAITAN